MNLEFSEEQLFIRDQARNFLSQECTAATVRGVLDSETPFDKELWQKIVDLGWTAMAIPENHGGLGLGYLELCVIAEELGRALAPVPFSSSVYLATEAIKSWGSEAQQQHLPAQTGSGRTNRHPGHQRGTGAPSAAASVVRGQTQRQQATGPRWRRCRFRRLTAQDDQGVIGLYLADLP